MDGLAVTLQEVIQMGRDHRHSLGHIPSPGKMMDRMDSNPGHAYKSLKIGPPKGQKLLPNTKSLRIENKAADTQIDGIKCRPKDKTKSCSVVEGGKFSNFKTTDLSGTQHPHKKETPVSNDGTKSARAIKPNFQGKAMQLPDTLAVDVVGVQQSACAMKYYHDLLWKTLTKSFGDVPGLGPSGSLVQDLALVYPPLQTSQTWIHAQMRAIVPSPETWVSLLHADTEGMYLGLDCHGAGVQPSKGKLKFGACYDVVGHGASEAVMFAIDQMKTRTHTEIGWSCGMEGCIVAGAYCDGHSGGGVAPDSTMSVTCSPDQDMVALVGGGGGDHPTGSNVPEYN
ncbi:hypothetical protein EDC04DRAFT_2609151 [Pisolithus marmoratus]|nr:hypothetical protein EDC04DRAFT_2609151 [Pisolithus marmoratus]